MIAPLGGKNHYLVKGPVTAQQVHFVHGGGGSSLEVVGADTSIAMDRESKSVLWSDVTESDAVTTIVGQYGYTPDVEATSAGHYEAKHTLVQRDSDLRFVRRLARRNGYLFWITCDETGTESAHFKRPAVGGDAGTHRHQPPLNNIASFASIRTWNGRRVVASRVNVNDKSTIDGDVESRRHVAQEETRSPRSSPDAVDSCVAPVDDAGDLHARSRGALVEAGWFLHVQRRRPGGVHAIVRANSVVTVRGVGKRHSGKCPSPPCVTLIDAVGHKMQLELRRRLG